MTRTGVLELSLQQVSVPEPAADEVVVRVQAAPINPSDLGLLLGPVDPTNLTSSGSGDDVVIRGQVPEAILQAFAARIDQSMPVGNEGAGSVIKTGTSDAARALKGRLVAMIGGGMYATHRVIKASDCLPLPDNVTAAQGASCFVNPLTALGMVETMRREGHKGLVHTAAASNLGQMLNRICVKDGIPLVNIVRNAAQEALLRKLGAAHVIDSSAPGFMNDLSQAVHDTRATIAFDAIGGGTLASRILTAMEAAINRSAKVYSRYGSDTHKQVYIYGNLDLGQTVLARGIGMAWGIGGWLLFPFLQRIGATDAARLRQRVLDELTTTFASHYTKTVSLRGALAPENIRIYGKRATGEKYLIDPSKSD
ncbi:NADH oxidase [Bradyrhizobium brasilense]|uniref:zinc-binding dehydrogenase n=1 Tax=Bradyrhizobium brasilense TaxID=1419277 RepID=UPI0016B93444|nr:zinc-binding dehydrogenase [Bradyrhizobium brasilense]NLS68198.1 NADH oxidase [Bradyrhizobium brasilense]